jgi:hypothetical protein
MRLAVFYLVVWSLTLGWTGTRVARSGQGAKTGGGVSAMDGGYGPPPGP